MTCCSSLAYVFVSPRLRAHCCHPNHLATNYPPAVLLPGIAAQAPAPPAYSTCQNKFMGAMQAIGKGNTASTYAAFIDPDTPEAACTLQLCQGSYDQCDPLIYGKDNPPKKEDLLLVFSDEFEEQERSFAVQDGDLRWTAEDMYYFPTGDLEVYKPEQFTTWRKSLSSGLHPAAGT